VGHGRWLHESSRGRGSCVAVAIGFPWCVDGGKRSLVRRVLWSSLRRMISFGIQAVCQMRTLWKQLQRYTETLCTLPLGSNVHMAWRSKVPGRTAMRFGTASLISLPCSISHSLSGGPVADGRVRVPLHVPQVAGVRVAALDVRVEEELEPLPCYSTCGGDSGCGCYSVWRRFAGAWTGRRGLAACARLSEASRSVGWRRLDSIGARCAPAVVGVQCADRAARASVERHRCDGEAPRYGEVQAGHEVQSSRFSHMCGAFQQY